MFQFFNKLASLGTGVWAPAPAETPTFRSATSDVKPAIVATDQEIAALQQAADEQYGLFVARQTADAVGDPNIDPMLTALLTEEGKLQRILAQHATMSQEAEEKLARANEPDPQLQDYVASLEDRVLVQEKTLAAEAAAEAAQQRLEAGERALRRETDTERAAQERYNTAARWHAQLSQANAALHREAVAVEVRFASARSDHRRRVAEITAKAEDARQRAREAELSLAPLEADVARLEAEVMWYRLRCGEELPAVWADGDMNL